MGLKCMIRCCSKQEMRGIVSVHAFPKEKDVCDKWEEFVRKIDPKFVHKPGARYGICSKHFEEKYFRNLGQFQLGYATVLHLLKDAIPTKYPDLVIPIQDGAASIVANVPLLFQNPETMTEVEKSTAPRKYIRSEPPLVINPISPVLQVVDSETAPAVSKDVLAKKRNVREKTRRIKQRNILPKPVTQSCLPLILPQNNSVGGMLGKGKRKSIDQVAMLIRLRKICNESQLANGTTPAVTSSPRTFAAPTNNELPKGYQLLPLNSTSHQGVPKAESAGRTWVLLPDSSTPRPQTATSQVADQALSAVKDDSFVMPCAITKDYFKSTLLAMYQMQKKNILCDFFFHLTYPGLVYKKVKNVGIGVHRSVFAAVSEKVRTFDGSIMCLGETCRVVSISRVIEFAYTGEIKALQSFGKPFVLSVYAAAVTLDIPSCILYLKKNRPDSDLPEFLPAGEVGTLFLISDAVQDAIETEVITDMQSEGEYLHDFPVEAAEECDDAGTDGLKHGSTHHSEPGIVAKDSVEQLSVEVGTKKNGCEIPECSINREASTNSKTIPARPADEEHSSAIRNKSETGVQYNNLSPDRSECDKSDSNSCEDATEHMDCDSSQASSDNCIDKNRNSGNGARISNNDALVIKKLTVELESADSDDDEASKNHCDAESNKDTMNIAKLFDRKLFDRTIDDDGEDECIYVELQVSDMEEDELSDEYLEEECST